MLLRRKILFLKKYFCARSIFFAKISKQSVVIPRSNSAFGAGGGIGIRVRLRGACLTAWGFESPPAHINLKSRAKAWDFSFMQGTRKLLCVCGEEKGGAMFLFELIMIPYGERQKPRARPAGVLGQQNDRKESPPLRI